jgi:hypothetical protein
MEGYFGIIAVVKNRGYAAFSRCGKEYRLCIENAAVDYGDLESIDWLWGWHEHNGDADDFSQFVLLMFAHHNWKYPVRYLEWYSCKKPVTDWSGSGVWYAAANASRDWINKRTPIQDLAVRNIKYCNKKIFVSAAYPLIQLGLNSQLDTVLLSKTIAYDKPSILWALVKRDHKLVRETILADSGKLLRAARKKIRRVLPQILSLSDYASVGLLPSQLN